MIEDNPTSLGYWGDPNLTKKISTKGRALKQVLKLLKQLKEAEGGGSDSDSSDDDSNFQLLKGIIERSATDIVIPEGVTSIGELVFAEYADLTSITIPNSVTKIGKSSFSSCWGLTSIVIPNSVTEISSYAFNSCTNIEYIYIGNGITKIGSGAFYEVSNPTVIITATAPPELQSFAFDHSSPTIYVPNESETAYKTASGWSSYANSIHPMSEYSGELPTT